MGRPIKRDALTPMGRLIADWARLHGVSLSELQRRLGWRGRRLHRLMRGCAVSLADAGLISDVTGISLARLRELEQREGI